MRRSYTSVHHAWHFTPPLRYRRQSASPVASQSLIARWLELRHLSLLRRTLRPYLPMTHYFLFSVNPTLSRPFSAPMLFLHSKSCASPLGRKNHESECPSAERCWDIHFGVSWWAEETMQSFGEFYKYFSKLFSARKRTNFFVCFRLRVPTVLYFINLFSRTDHTQWALHAAWIEPWCLNNRDTPALHDRGIIMIDHRHRGLHQ